MAFTSVTLIILIEQKFGVTNEKTLLARKETRMGIHPSIGMSIKSNGKDYRVEEVRWDDDTFRVEAYLHPDRAVKDRSQKEMSKLREEYTSKGWLVRSL